MTRCATEDGNPQRTNQKPAKRRNDTVMQADKHIILL
jgi:hypothetical protein